MAATFLQTLVERYDAIKQAGWPEIFSGIQPPGTARTFPNHLLEHLGEKPEDGKGGNSYEFDAASNMPKIAAVVGRVRFTFWATSIEVAEGWALALQTGMEAEPLTVGSDVNVVMFRQEYRVTPTIQMGPEAQFVYAAATLYMAMFNPGS